MHYTIEKADSGWNIFKTSQSLGKYIMLHVEGSYEEAYALMLEFLNNERLIRKGIASLKQRRIRLKAIRKAIYIDVDNPWTSLLHPSKHEGDQDFSVNPRRRSL